MAVKLGDWLLRKNKITEEQLSRALQDQAIFGGRLGSSLIKLEYVDEDTLGEYLADVSGVHYATARRLDAIPPDVIAAVPARLAAQYRIIPIAIEGRRLHLAMRDPKDLIALDEIAFLTGLAIEPYVATEYRILRGLERHYGIALGSRTIPVSGGVALEPVRPRTVTLPTRPTPASSKPEVGLDGLPLDADPAEIDEPFVRSRPGAAQSPREPDEPIPSSLEEWRMAQREMPESFPEGPRPPLPSPAAPALAATSVPAPPLASPAQVAAAPVSAVPAASTLRVAASFPAAVPTLVAARTLETLSARLRAAETRDEVFDSILEFTAARFRRCALFVLHQDRVLGWSGRGDGLSAARIRNVTVPLARPSLFVFFRDGGDYYYGPVPDLPANARFYLDMGCPPPARVLLMPLTIKERPAVILYADNGPDGSGTPEIDLLRQALRKASMALEVLILKNKIMMA